MHSNLLAAAITGLVLGASRLAQAQTTTGAKHGCKGQNACKGQGGCKTDSPKSDKNSCAGKGGCGTK